MVRVNQVHVKWRMRCLKVRVLVESGLDGGVALLWAVVVVAVAVAVRWMLSKGLEASRWALGVRTAAWFRHWRRAIALDAEESWERRSSSMLGTRSLGGRAWADGLRRRL